MRQLRTLLTLVAVAWLAWVVPEARANATFGEWLESFRERAAAEGYSADLLSRALAGVSYNDKVLEADQYQPEFVRPIWEYLDRAVSDRRIADGKRALARHGDTLQQIGQVYPVPAGILVAIWGIESAYGRAFGSFRVVEALATLSFAGRRPAFSEPQLLAALEIIRTESFDPAEMLGSWAGAMGHTQFIPTSYLSYAVDFDGDGRRDIWADDPGDALASAANYLTRRGWRTNEPWGVEVLLPESFDYRLASYATKRSPAEWRESGVMLADGTPLPDWQPDTTGSILTPTGNRGPAFLVLPNFRALLAYNNATSYALAVAHLADRIQGGNPFEKEWPRRDRRLDVEEIREIQQRLADAGHDPGGIDGISGPATRAAVRAFQIAHGEVPDGYVSAVLLDALRALTPAAE